MDLDPYQPCPGGLDKKIKFCCKDLIRELDDVSRKLEANQLEAARLMLNQLQQKHGDRDCLSAIGCSLSLRLDDLETAGENIRQFHELSPENPVGLALAAITAAGVSPPIDEDGKVVEEVLKQQSRTAMDLLQQSLGVCGNHIPVQVYEAVAILGHRMLAEGQTLAARELFTLQAIMSDEGAEESVSHIMEIGRSTASALLKPSPPLATILPFCALRCQ